MFMCWVGFFWVRLEFNSFFFFLELLLWFLLCWGRGMVLRDFGFLLQKGFFSPLSSVSEVTPVWGTMDKEIICTALVKNHKKFFTLLLG